MLLADCFLSKSPSRPSRMKGVINLFSNFLSPVAMTHFRTWSFSEKLKMLTFFEDRAGKWRR